MAETDFIGDLSYGNVDRSKANILQSGHVDFTPLTITGKGDNYALSSAIGTDYVVRHITNNSGADGNILVKTANDVTGDFVTYPVLDGFQTPLLPVITHIKETGSISSCILWLDKIA